VGSRLRTRSLGRPRESPVRRRRRRTRRRCRRRSLSRPGRRVRGVLLSVRRRARGALLNGVSGSITTGGSSSAVLDGVRWSVSDSGLAGRLSSGGVLLSVRRRARGAVRDRVAEHVLKKLLELAPVGTDRQIGLDGEARLVSLHVPPALRCHVGEGTNSGSVAASPHARASESRLSSSLSARVPPPPRRRVRCCTPPGSIPFARVRRSAVSQVVADDAGELREPLVLTFQPSFAFVAVGDVLSHPGDAGHVSVRVGESRAPVNS